MKILFKLGLDFFVFDNIRFQDKQVKQAERINKRINKITQRGPRENVTV